MNRVNVVGTSGSGKSTFARQLAERMQAPYIEMDVIHWLPDWQEKSDNQFFADLKSQLQTEYWVLDGNYNKSLEVKWQDVDTVIWLDYSFAITAYRAITRALSRCLSKQELWPGTGNVETFKQTFMSKDSILLWTLKTFRRNRRRYLDMIAAPEYQHIKFIRIRHPKQAKRFLANIQPVGRAETVDIRAAHEQDIDALLDLNRQIGEMHHQQAPHVFAPPSEQEREFLLQALKSSERLFLVAEYDHQVVGFITAVMHSNEAIPFLVKDPICRIGTLVVDEKHRGQGVGEKLMQACLDWAKQSGASDIRLEVMAFNQGAEAFYHKLGFECQSKILSKRP